MDLTLRQVRRRQGWLQRDLAAVVGISVTALSQIENGHTFPRPDTRHRLEVVLNCDFIEWRYPVKRKELLTLMSQYIDHDPTKAHDLNNHINKHLQVLRLNILKTKHKAKWKN